MAFELKIAQNIMFKVLLILFFKFNSLSYCFVIIIAGRKAEMQEEAVWHCLSRQVGMGHPRSKAWGHHAAGIHIQSYQYVFTLKIVMA